MSRTVNLARERFVNRRPVVRLVVLLWVVGGALAAVNALNYYGYLVGSGERADRLGELEASISAERSRSTALEGQLRQIDLRSQNVTVSFLNRKIGERTFAWSRLFQLLGELTPSSARIVSLSPATGERRGLGDEQDPAAGQIIPLDIAGEAKDEESLYRLVDALFDHPSFRNPSPTRQAWQQTGLLRFDLTVGYLPETGEAEDSP